jgi:hypothetical protein
MRRILIPSAVLRRFLPFKRAPGGEIAASIVLGICKQGQTGAARPRTVIATCLFGYTRKSGMPAAAAAQNSVLAGLRT